MKPWYSKFVKVLATIVGIVLLLSSMTALAEATKFDWEYWNKVMWKLHGYYEDLGSYAEDNELEMIVQVMPEVMKYTEAMVDESNKAGNTQGREYAAKINDKLPLLLRTARDGDQPAASLSIEIINSYARKVMKSHPMWIIRELKLHIGDMRDFQKEGDKENLIDTASECHDYVPLLASVFKKIGKTELIPKTEEGMKYMTAVMEEKGNPLDHLADFEKIVLEFEGVLKKGPSILETDD